MVTTVKFTESRPPYFTDEASEEQNGKGTRSKASNQHRLDEEPCFLNRGLPTPNYWSGLASVEHIANTKWDQLGMCGVRCLFL